MGERSTKGWLAMAVAAIAVSASILASCGGDNSSGSPPERTTEAATTVSAGPFSKEQYLARINRYCRNSWNRILQRYAEFQNEHKPRMSDEDFFAEATKSFIIPGIQFQFDEMRRGGVPEGDEQQVEELVGVMQLKVEHGQDRYIASPQQLTALFTPYNHLSQRYGFRECIVREAFFGRIKPSQITDS